ncbi:putative solute:sodium symporter small subunit [Colwellia chukchiensis]|uniref:Putative solute:sodium symporter small subunit n=1 Tax=Colwellia chukchiensis TaxID=641665 RepID=A0A1H7GBB3_9GAMM|nr:TonB-dependent receptor [Colwellia chukchiensis]SEK35411.1 putative solute:sodium symporter small subunit [Colwellia chukchiensis]
MDKKFILTSFAYAIAGLTLGIFMAATKNHGQLVTHTHILLIGFVMSFIYALCHKLWLDKINSRLAKLQYYLHQLGTLGVVIGLFLFYGNFVALEAVDPLLALSSITVLIALILMKVLFIQTLKK